MVRSPIDGCLKCSGDHEMFRCIFYLSVSCLKDSILYALLYLMGMSKKRPYPSVYKRYQFLCMMHPEAAMHNVARYKGFRRYPYGPSTIKGSLSPDSTTIEKFSLSFRNAGSLRITPALSIDNPIANVTVYKLFFSSIFSNACTKI
jgi:hypothetical protein